MRFKEQIKLFSEKVQWCAILAIFGIFIAFSSCNKDCNCDNEGQYPSLKVVNQTYDIWSITSVTLVGYEFNNLNIVVGKSQTFALEKGMPGGFNDIYIKVMCKQYSQSGYAYITVNFTNGGTTTITLKGNGSGFSLE